MARQLEVNFPQIAGLSDQLKCIRHVQGLAYGLSRGASADDVALPAMYWAQRWMGDPPLHKCRALPHRNPRDVRPENQRPENCRGGRVPGFA